MHPRGRRWWPWLAAIAIAGWTAGVAAADQALLGCGVVGAALVAWYSDRHPRATAAVALAAIIAVPVYWGPSIPGGNLVLTPAIVVAPLLAFRFLPELGSSRVDGWDVLVMAYGIVVVASTIGSFGLARAPLLDAVLGGPVLLYPAARGVMTDRRRAATCSSVFVGVVAVCALAMVLERATGYNPWVEAGGSRGLDLDSGALRFGGVRAEGPFSHPNIAGIVCGAAMVVALARALRPTGLHLRWFALAGACAAGALATQSRTALAVSVFGVALLALHAVRASRGRALLVAVLVASVGFLATGTAERIQQVGESLTETDTTLGNNVTHRTELASVLLDTSYFEWLAPEAGPTDASADDIARRRSPVRDPASEYAAVFLSRGALALALLLALSLRSTVFTLRSRGDGAWAAAAAVIGLGMFGTTLFGQLGAVLWFALGSIPRAGPDRRPGPEATVGDGQLRSILS